MTSADLADAFALADWDEDDAQRGTWWEQVPSTGRAGSRAGSAASPRSSSVADPWTNARKLTELTLADHAPLVECGTCGWCGPGAARHLHRQPPIYSDEERAEARAHSTALWTGTTPPICGGGTCFDMEYGGSTAWPCELAKIAQDLLAQCEEHDAGVPVTCPECGRESRMVTHHHTWPVR